MPRNVEWTDKISQAMALYRDTHGQPVHRRNIQRWVKDGVAANDPPPLLDPRAMLGWWWRIYPSRQPRQELLDAAERVGKPPRHSAAPPPPSDKPAPESNPAPRYELPPNLDAKDPDFYANNLHALRRAIAQAEASFTNSQDPGEKRGFLKDWVQLSEQARRLEKDWAKLEEASGVLVKRSVVINQIHLIHGHLDAGVRSLYRRLCTTRGREPDPEDASTFEALVDKLFGDWHLNNFGLGFGENAEADQVLDADDSQAVDDLPLFAAP